MMENKTKIDLKNKSIFITGVAGFIGSNLAKRLLSTVKGVKVVGLDNMNHYYDVRLKEARLNELEQFESFSFVKGNLADKAVIESIFEQYKPEIVVNLGAQAGVRYSITNPDAYVEANLIGFYNILEACRHSYDEGHTPVEHLVYSVNFEQGTVSLQDMTLAKEARYPIFRTEPLEYIRHLYEQADVPMEEAVEITVFTALHNAGVAYEDFSPEQMDVIYSVAESGGELEELLNPDFSPEQMQLIADVQARTDAIHRSAVDDVLNPLTSKPMTPEEVNHARRQHNLPLDSGAETEQPVQPKQEPMNFRITDDDLGAGGAKTKFKANIEAIRLLQTLDHQR